MFRKHISLLLILTIVLSVASCSTADPAAGTEPSEVELSRSQESVYESIDKIATALAGCDYESLQKKCDEDGLSKLKNSMPVIEVEEDADDDTPLVDKVDKELMIRNMIAATITYRIDENTYEGGFLGRDPSVDVIFSYKNYHTVIMMRDRFMGPGEFNTLLADVEKTEDFRITLHFRKDGMKYILTNAGDLEKLYDYENTDLDYYQDYFDLVTDVYLTGPGFDPYTNSFYDTNTVEIVFELDEDAAYYVWDYKWAFASDDPSWEYIKISDEIVDKYPTEIHITYTQEENIAPGYYALVLCDLSSSAIYGLEFDVYNSAYESEEI